MHCNEVHLEVVVASTPLFGLPSSRQANVMVTYFLHGSTWHGGNPTKPFHTPRHFPPALQKKCHHQNNAATQSGQLASLPERFLRFNYFH